MKSTYIIYFLLAVIIAGALFGKLEYNEKDRAHQLELKREGEKLKSREDSLRGVINRKDEQILKAFRDIREAEILRDIANEQAADYKRKYENIKIRTHSTDLERSDALKRLYPN